MDSEQQKQVFAEIISQKPYEPRLSGRLVETLVECDGRTFNAVIGEIDYLERLPGVFPTRTRKQKRLHGEILGKLRHTHYFTSEHLIENIRLYWADESRQPEIVELRRRMVEAAEGADSDDAIWKLSGDIAEKIVSAHKVRRDARKLTGEWIVYAEWGSQNYYLDLAVHAELDDEQALYDRLYHSCPEFDFCFK